MNRLSSNQSRIEAGETRASGDDDPIFALLTRLARPDKSGGRVVERAALMASGGDLAAIEAWIGAHGGTAEATDSVSPRQGLHGIRRTEDRPSGRTVLRFVIPPGVL
jgi:hypothetical protein